jgi:hypothetical protein
VKAIKHDIGRLPVVEKGEIVGIFSRSDAVADLYGLCPLGDDLAADCRQNKFSFSSTADRKSATIQIAASNRYLTLPETKI